MSGDTDPKEGASRDPSRESLDLRERFAAEFRAGRRPDAAAFANDVGQHSAELTEELVLLERLLVRAELDGKELTKVLSDGPTSSSWSESGTSCGLGSDTADGGGAVSPPLIGRFRFVELLGQGGFGSVWRAVDTRLDREVAVKVARRRASVAPREMLLRESRSAARLNHPNIVPIYEVGLGEDGTLPYIVSALVEGPNLREWAGGRPVAPEKAASIALAIARALEHAHGRGVVHRDLKPANILMDVSDAPHVVDFGLAKRTANGPGAPDDGPITGTPAYMAPEQARGDEAAVGPAADVYSLGVILHELLAGRRPPLDARANGDGTDPPPQPPCMFPRALRRVCDRCLKADPLGRYPSMDGVARDLSDFLSEREPPAADRPRRRPWEWLAVAAASAALAVWLMPGPRLRHEARRLVRIHTSSRGCEVTAIRLDKGGGPDPSRMEKAAGVTPLEMRLPPGDYMIVAAHPDRGFHEVLRHVPAVGEVPPGRHERHLTWEESPSGAVTLPEITVWGDSVAARMARLNAAAAWGPPSTLPTEAGLTLAVPEFYVDLKEVKAGRAGSGASDYHAAVADAERLGARLPSSLELLYAQDYCHAAKASPGGLVTPRLHLVTGLFELPYELTNTVVEHRVASPGGRNRAADLPDRRVVRGGSRPHPPNGPATGPTFPHTTGDVDSAGMLPLGGIFHVRGVRSSRPRTKPEDFIRASAATATSPGSLSQRATVAGAVELKAPGSQP